MHSGDRRAYSGVRRRPVPCKRGTTSCTVHGIQAGLSLFENTYRSAYCSPALTQRNYSRMFTGMCRNAEGGRPAMKSNGRAFDSSLPLMTSTKHAIF